MQIDETSSEVKLVQALKDLNDQKFALDAASIVAITDARGIITYVNDKFLKISKYSRKELIGKSHKIINSGYHPKEFFSELWRVIQSGEVWRGDIKNRAKDGSHYWVHTTIVPFLNEQNTPYQYVAIRTDITDKINALEQIEIERARTIHSEKMATLGQLAAGMAHELGNPIGSIVSWLEVIGNAAKSKTLDSIDFEHTIESVKERAQYMQKIISGMLTYSRDGSKDPFAVVNLNIIMSKVFGYCGYKIKKHGVEVILQYDEKESFFCQGKESELAQVFGNLIINSCDAISDLSQKWIKIDIQRKAKWLEVSVTDSGAGIPEVIQTRMMEPFFTTKPAGKGTGLGLSISMAVVKEHGGELIVDKNSPHTKFVVRLPV